MVANQQFRSDLYYRLNVVNVHLPPLRERLEDVAVLFDHYMTEMSASKIDAQALTSEAMTILTQYDWPGNVREIKNLVELLLIEPARKYVSPEDLPSYMRCGNPISAPCERDRLIAALSATFWNKSQAAKQLHCSRMTLYRKMIKYDLALSRSAPKLHSTSPS
jgi:DNA-binding NtrC family response regulator